MTFASLALIFSALNFAGWLWFGASDFSLVVAIGCLAVAIFDHRRNAA